MNNPEAPYKEVYVTQLEHADQHTAACVQLLTQLLMYPFAQSPQSDSMNPIVQKHTGRSDMHDVTYFQKHGQSGFFAAYDKLRVRGGFDIIQCDFDVIRPSFVDSHRSLRLFGNGGLEFKERSWIEAERGLLKRRQNFAPVLPIQMEQLVHDLKDFAFRAEIAL